MSIVYAIRATLSYALLATLAVGLAAAAAISALYFVGIALFLLTALVS